jgi:UDP:flavonoid glycosyltransferase YjiC (YdhE family)
MGKSKTVLVCPLDWGLGHATRMVPVIDLLVRKGANVVIGADRGPLAYLQQRFPDLKSVVIEGYTPEYPATGSMSLAMIKAYPEMMAKARKAQSRLTEIITKLKIQVVISDNRYELYSSEIYSVFVTHQLHIKTPGLRKLAHPFIKRKINGYIKRYDELWIPDLEGIPNLAGSLSHPARVAVRNTHYIGPLSRFSLTESSDSAKKTELVAVLSGPEPQRTFFEQLIFEQASQTGMDTLIVRGKPEEMKQKQVKNIKMVTHLPDTELRGIIQKAGIVVCRSGYSSIMDLAEMGKNAILVPTPGQTEQEYLARRFEKQGIYPMESQRDFNLLRSIRKMKNYSGLSIQNDYATLESRIEAILTS